MLKLDMELANQMRIPNPRAKIDWSSNSAQNTVGPHALREKRMLQTSATSANEKFSRVYKSVDPPIKS